MEQDHEYTGFRQVIPCEGWSYAYLRDDNKTVVWPVAAWALLQSGEVIGLIAGIARTNNDVAKLGSPPPVGGTYFLTADGIPDLKPFRVADI